MRAGGRRVPPALQAISRSVGAATGVMREGSTTATSPFRFVWVPSRQGVTLSLVVVLSHDSVMVPVARPNHECPKTRGKWRPLNDVGVTLSSVTVLSDDTVMRHRLVE